MNLHQLRFVRETVRQNFNLTEAARALFTSQPGVSKAILELEEELGFAIFQRHGKRLKGLTQPGKLVLDACERVLAELENIRRIGEEFAQHEGGQLRVAVTHTQARYVLPQAVAAFRQNYPKVKLLLLQGSPEQLVQWVRSDQADLAVATEALAEEADLVTLPCFEWGHVLVAARASTWAQDFAKDAKKNKGLLTLADIAAVPLITYERHFAGRKRIDAAMQKAGLVADVVLEAIDADVIKTYVGLGLGVGIVAEMAFDAERDAHLQAWPVQHLFGKNTTRIALRQGVFLREVLLAFIQTFAPSLSAKQVRQALGEG
jgi:LysR family cys regulon transcriptional activator